MTEVKKTPIIPAKPLPHSHCQKVFNILKTDRIQKSIEDRFERKKQDRIKGTSYIINTIYSIIKEYIARCRDPQTPYIPIISFKDYHTPDLITPMTQEEIEIEKFFESYMIKTLTDLGYTVSSGKHPAGGISNTKLWILIKNPNAKGWLGY